MLAQLTSLLKSKRLPHGIIWANPETEVLANFVKILMCQGRGEYMHACGQCKSCYLIQSEAGHPDVHWLKPEGKLNLIKIDSVREIIEFLSKSAQQGGYKVVVFEGAEGLNMAAQNALLKSLEEPSSHSLLVLQTAYPHLLLPTIKSRCQLFTDQDPQKAKTHSSVHEFIDALSFDFKPLAVATKFKDASLEILFNGWYEFLHEVLRVQQGLAIEGQWHDARVSIENAAQKNSAQLYAFVDELVKLKALVHKKIALNQQALLERALIKWHEIS